MLVWDQGRIITGTIQIGSDCVVGFEGAGGVSENYSTLLR
jgi:hypothetical protein